MQRSNKKQFEEVENCFDKACNHQAIKRRTLFKVAAGAVIATLPSQASAEHRVDGILGRGRTGPSVFKARAIADYQQSLTDFGGALTSSALDLIQGRPRAVPWQFDVLIVGSGYGASTVATRLGQRRHPDVRIAMFERGVEWIPGTFPDRLRDVLRESRLNLLGPRKGTVSNPTGLFNVQQFDEITVMSGSGLGGSSLINASVAIRADREVFEHALWPSVLRSRTALDPYYSLAEYELGAAREPVDSSRKMVAARHAGGHLGQCGANWQPASLTVTRTGMQPAIEPPIVNRQGMLQRGCISCGDCLMGCNIGAKNTLTMNYLPQARRAGVEMFTGVEVQFVRKQDSYYVVHYLHHLPQPNGEIKAISGCATARMVVLGAGSLGSTELLLRSQHHGMNFSHRLGQSWTGNGDALGFVRKTALPTSGSGYSAYETDRLPVGPTIQSNLTYPMRPISERVLIQDGAAPRAYANALGVLMRDLRLDNTQILLGMGHDGTAGRIVLGEHGNAKIQWPGLTETAYRRMVRDEFNRVAEAMGGKYEYLKIFGDNLISVHPLGGCSMADHVQHGVVNQRGEVFDALTGGTHQGLFVIDGAILPTSIACNPLLTITALAERASDQIVNDPNLSDLFRQPSA